MSRAAAVTAAAIVFVGLSGRLTRMYRADRVCPATVNHAVASDRSRPLVRLPSAIRLAPQRQRKTSRRRRSAARARPRKRRRTPPARKSSRRRWARSRQRSLVDELRRPRRRASKDRTGCRSCAIRPTTASPSVPITSCRPSTRGWRSSRRRERSTTRPARCCTARCRTTRCSPASRASANRRTTATRSSATTSSPIAGSS